MREILFRGKRVDNDEWEYGYYCETENQTLHKFLIVPSYASICYGLDVIPETVGQYTGLTDKNSTKIFEGDIVQYNTDMDFDCQSIVKFGEYKQDGSGGEYTIRKCLGFYVEVDNFTCPDWCENDTDCFSEYLWEQNLLEVANKCEVIGNIHDNPELLKELSK